MAILAGTIEDWFNAMGKEDIESIFKIVICIDKKTTFIYDICAS